MYDHDVQARRMQRSMQRQMDGTMACLDVMDRRWMRRQRATARAGDENDTVGVTSEVWEVAGEWLPMLPASCTDFHKARLMHNHTVAPIRRPGWSSPAGCSVNSACWTCARWAAP